MEAKVSVEMVKVDDGIINVAEDVVVVVVVSVNDNVDNVIAVVNVVAPSGVTVTTGTN